MQQQTSEKKATVKRGTLKKRNTDIIKMEVGDKVEGVLKGRTTGPWLDRATGEEKELTRVHFEREDGSRFLLFEDAGLKNALANAMINDGDFVVIEKLEKTALTGGRTVNQYDIFTYEN